MTRPSEAEVKPIPLAECLKALADAPGTANLEFRPWFLAARDALESQAKRIAELEASLAAIGSDTVEGKRIEEYVAHAVGRDTAKCALAAVKAALDLSCASFHVEEPYTLTLEPERLTIARPVNP